MPDLIQSLQFHDLGHLRIVAGLWGVELKSSEDAAALEELALTLLEPGLMNEIAHTLPAEARKALGVLVAAGGRMPWALFTRLAGELRDAGAGRRDREQLYLHPVSAAEVLFYRALLGRAFFETQDGLQEFAYIPAELFIQLQNKELEDQLGDAAVTQPGSKHLGRPATPREREHPLPLCDRLLDDATTLLAALRMEIDPPETVIPVNIVGEFLRAAGILAGSEPHPEMVKTFLEMPRREGLILLTKFWKESETFNELRQIPAIACEGEWRNDPHVTRQLLLGFLRGIPRDRWWSLASFIQELKAKQPDFQRPAGDYDTWFIKRRSDEVYLRGFTSWDEVDGALIRYLICEPMYWLGLVELATPEENEAVTAFRIPSKAKSRTPVENGKLHVSSQGRILVPRLLPRAVRYQLARFFEWEEARPDEYRYRVTTASMQKAAEQGLKVNQLLSLMAKHAAAEIPPAFVKALKRWERNGTEARVETRTVLHVNRPEVLEELRKSKAGRFLGEVLGPVTVTVKPGAQTRVMAALTELGLLAEESSVLEDDIPNG